ncbi:MAG: hypothetical protein WA981_14105 [Glaciecola sp.]
MSDLFFIPTGDYLRQFLGNSMIKASDIKGILKKRGTFSSSSEKKILGPLLVKSGISASEFDMLKDAIQTKEENPKIQSSKIAWEGSATLIDAIPHDFDFSDLIDDPFGTLIVDNVPCFTTVGDGKNPNHLITEITVRRQDKTKNFGDDVTYHKCSVELRLDNDSNIELNILTKHSSKETHNLVNKLSRRVHKFLKSNGHIKSTSLERVLFGNFSNENRIDFMLSMAQSNDMYLYYKDTKKLNIAPDESISGPIPPEIALFEKKINELMFRGKGLDSSVYLGKPEVKKHIKLNSVTSNYELNDEQHQGHCQVKIYFPDFERNSELMMEVESLSIQKKLPIELKSDIKLQILKLLESKKIELYRKYSTK